MKIIGSDYDGTLNHNGIDDAKKEAISRWRKAGNVFSLVSGRGPEEILTLYRNNSFECDYLVADSGALILTPDGSVVSDVRCDGELAVPLIDLLFECGCPFATVLTAFPCRVYADKSECHNAGEYTKDNMPKIEYFNQISTMLPDFESASSVTQKVKDRFSDTLNPLQNGRCIDIVRADMNKAKGLCILSELLGAKHEDVITVGDNINDIDMLTYFRSYAMKNGVDRVKAIADDITEGITELIGKELAKE